MEVKYINEFIQAANEVLKEISDIEFKHGKVKSGEWSQPTDKISIVLSIRGQISGGILYSMINETAEMIVTRWLKKDGISLDRLEDLKESCLTELGTMITGKFVGKLKIASELIYITPPLIVDNVTNFVYPKIIITSLEMVSDFGNIEISFALQTAE